MRHLVLGGARSGKSQFAEQWVKGQQKTPVYIATGWAGDEEMQARIEHHKNQRGSDWVLVEEPIALANTLKTYNTHQYAILVDCLTLWLSNALHQKVWQQEKQALMDVVAHLHCDIAFVGNEVGSGIVPLGSLSRAFVDESGWLNQALAKQCHQVSLVVAGIPMALKHE